MQRLTVWLSAFLIVAMVATPVWATPTEVKLVASDGIASDYFGATSYTGVAISGDFAIVGANGADPDGSLSGAAYIFHFDGNGWVEQQKLTASDGAVSNNFGYSVAISGNTAIVGAYYGDGNVSDTGAAYVYHYDGAQWIEQQKLVATDGAVYDRFGEAVAISGNHVIIGAYGANGYNTDAGAAYVFTYDGANWVEQQKLVASDGGVSDWFGKSVSIAGDYAIVGAPLDDDKGSASGSAYIFQYDGASWTELEKLTAYDGAIEDRFGGAVSISGSNAVIGASMDDGSLQNSGSAYVFHYSGGTWVEQQKLLDQVGQISDSFGRSVSISENLAIVSGSLNRGEAFIYQYDGLDWIQAAKLTASDAAPADWFSEAVAISGDKAIVGAPYDDDKGTSSGSAYIYTDFSIIVDADNDGYDSTEDCNDNAAAIHPGAQELCGDRLDNDCDNLVDSGDSDCPADADGDGYTVMLDCNDNAAAVNPDAPEVCTDRVDNDCDGLTDSADANCPADIDGDGYTVMLDCNDNAVAINPAAREVCGDGLDNNCNGLADSKDAACAPGCRSTAGSEKGRTCNDGIDNDCDGLTDTVDPDCMRRKEGKGKTCSDGIDNDGDQLIDCADPGCSTHKVCR